MDHSETFIKAHAFYSNQEYYGDFQEYLKTAKQNGVSENARYFFFIAREIILNSQESFREFYDYMESKHSNFLSSIYRGGGPNNKKISPAITQSLDGEPVKWTDV